MQKKRQKHLPLLMGLVDILTEGEAKDGVGTAGAEFSLPGGRLLALTPPLRTLLFVTPSAFVGA